MALNVVCCETAIRLESGAERKLLTLARNVENDPERTSPRPSADYLGHRFGAYFAGFAGSPTTTNGAQYFGSGRESPAKYILTGEAQQIIAERGVGLSGG
jgi:cytochrome oxidase Cu insertion factor (SCO1/SenC/PrrC family)